MITTLDCARACYDTYYHPERFDKWYEGDVCAGVVARDGYTLIACRGSVTRADWIKDFALDFEEGVNELAMNLLVASKDVLVITGHSLGGAHALLLLQRLVPIARICVTFAAPRCLSNLFGTEECYIEQWRNGNDPVPVIPLPNLYHARELKAIGPKSDIAVRDHHIECYISSLLSDEAAGLSRRSSEGA